MLCELRYLCILQQDITPTLFTYAGVGNCTLLLRNNKIVRTKRTSSQDRVILVKDMFTLGFVCKDTMSWTLMGLLFMITILILENLTVFNLSIFLEFIFLLLPCGSCEMQPLGYFSPDKPALIVVFGGWLTDYILRVSRHAI